MLRNGKLEIKADFSRSLLLPPIVSWQQQQSEHGQQHSFSV
jgi:hypothetical protein